MLRAGSMRQETIYPLKEIIEGLDDRHPAKVGICVTALIGNCGRFYANSFWATNRATTQSNADFGNRDCY